MPAATMRQGDLTQEFEEIFRRHFHFVYRTAFKVTGSRQDAEDIVQTIFLRLLRRELPAALRAKPQAYLYRAAINASVSALRSQRRHHLTDDFSRLETPSPDTGDQIEKQQQDRLRGAIGQLSPQAVELLILRYEHGYSDAEIAKLLGKSRGTIAVTLYRARARLKRLVRVDSGEKL